MHRLKYATIINKYDAKNYYYALCLIHTCGTYLISVTASFTYETKLRNCSHVNASSQAATITETIMNNHSTANMAHAVYDTRWFFFYKSHVTKNGYSSLQNIIIVLYLKYNTLPYCEYCQHYSMDGKYDIV